MSQDGTPIVNCPSCGKSVIWNESSPYRPFCRKRCQLIDLGEWAAEEKVIQGNQLYSNHDEWGEEPGRD